MPDTPLRKRNQERMPEKSVKVSSIIEGFNIRDVVTTLGGITGIIVAVLWLGGRSYIAGYFLAMNIPSFQVGLSIWEYAEASWQRLIYYFLEIIYVFFVYATVTVVSVYLVSMLLQLLIPGLKIADATKKAISQFKRLRLKFERYWLLIVVLFVFYFLLLALVDINRSGQEVGRETVLNKSQAVDIYSGKDLPLELDMMSKFQDILPDTLIHYSGLKLLTYNNGKYYLFRDVDPISCKPKQVFIIKDTDDVYFVLGAVSPVDAPCVSSAIVETISKSTPVP